MTGTSSESNGEPTARLKKVVSELVPELEEKYWKTETMNGFRHVFDEASELLGKKMGVTKFIKERTSLSAISEHYAKKKPQEVLAFLSHVNPARFDGGHIITVGIGMFYSFPKKDDNSQPGKLAMGFGVFSNGFLSVPFERINFAAYHDPVKGLRDLRRRLAEKVDLIAKGENPYEKKAYRSATYTPYQPLPYYNSRNNDFDWEMDMRRREADERDARISNYASQIIRGIGDEDYLRGRLHDLGLDDEDVRLRTWVESQYPGHYGPDDDAYYRYLDDNRYP